MSDPLAPFLLNLPEVTRDTIQNADDATQAGLATNYSSAERQIKFSIQQADEILDVEIYLADAAKIAPFCEHVSAYVNKLKQFPPLQSNTPSTITKLYDFHEALQAARRRYIKQAQSVVTVPLVPVETNGRKSKKRKTVLTPATVASDDDVSDVEIVDQDVDMDSPPASTKKSNASKSSKSPLPNFSKKSEPSARVETVCIPYVRNARVDKLSPGYIKAMKVLSQTNAAEADKVFAEHSRAPPRPRRYRARFRYRFEEAYSPSQGGSPVKSGEVAPDLVQTILDAGANIDDALIRKEIYIRGKMVDHMNEMSYAHHMYTQVRVEHDKTLKIMSARKLQVQQSPSLSSQPLQLPSNVVVPSSVDLPVAGRSLVAVLLAVLVAVFFNL
ncbi:hypothetical protein GGX14DRAFT_568702 [Mycena pura]|uniref:Uncharacterized protein n=1 Tax=Mycena pura TaxID=153505 RepID=A0AAD6Y7L9_9AGAR|nr:hypothetical protein GGX14DRAFT_568702 [Mycena pura]